MTLPDSRTGNRQTDLPLGRQPRCQCCRGARVVVVGGEIVTCPNCAGAGVRCSERTLFDSILDSA